MNRFEIYKYRGFPVQFLLNKLDILKKNQSGELMLIYVCASELSVHYTYWVPRHYPKQYSMCTCAYTGEFPANRPVTRSFDVVFDLRLDKRLSKQ